MAQKKIDELENPMVRYEPEVNKLLTNGYKSPMWIAGYLAGKFHPERPRDCVSWMQIKTYFDKGNALEHIPTGNVLKVSDRSELLDRVLELKTIFDYLIEKLGELQKTDRYNEYVKLANSVLRAIELTQRMLESEQKVEDKSREAPRQQNIFLINQLDELEKSGVIKIINKEAIDVEFEEVDDGGDPSEET